MTARSGSLTHPRRAASLLLFSSLALGIYAVAFYLRAILPALDRADAVAAGLTLDLAVVVPLLWYFLMVRRGRVPWFTIAPVTIASLLAASRIVPATHHQTLTVLEFAAVPLELALLGYLGWKATTAFRRARAQVRGEPDAFSAIRAAAHEVVPHPRVAAIAADELSVLYGGLASWWARPPAGERFFTSYKDNAFISVIVGVLLAIAVELFPVHVLIGRWSTVAAWIVTALSAYSAVWVLADLQAIRLRPIRLGHDGLDLRFGLRWDVSLAFENIGTIERMRPGAGRSKERTLNTALIGDPTHRITLRRPVEARGLYGFRRMVERIEFAVDGPARFDARLAELGRPVGNGLPTPTGPPGGGA